MMKTVGVSVGEADGRSAVCAVRWISECALVDLPELACTDEDVFGAMARADWIGVDAPFGWPHDIVSAIQTFGYFGRWPEGGVTERLRFRQTDWFVHDIVADERDEDVWPLSAPGDRFAERALRCAHLLSAYAERVGWTIDRIGVPPRLGADGPPGLRPGQGLVADGGVVEVHAPAALAMWGFPHKRYQAPSSAGAARDVRVSILAGLERASGAWLILSDDVRERCIESLVACAAATDRTLKPDITQLGTAVFEGWIHLPSPDSFETLAPAAV
jgi:hypothetical protein